MKGRRAVDAFRDAFGHLGRAKARHSVSLAVLILSFLMSGLFLSLSNNLRGRAQELFQDVAVVVYLKSDASADERRLVEERVRRSPLIASIRTVEPEEAKGRFLTEFPDLKEILENLGRNPLPVSLEATLCDPASPGGAIASFMNEIRTLGGVDEVRFNRAWSDRIRALGRLSDAVGLVVGGLLILVSIIVVSGAVRLNILGRRQEIDILRLVGATNGYIRIPFLLEGTILGVAGGLLAVALVALAVRLFPLYLGNSLGALQELLGFRALSILQALGRVFRT
jgi:cell division transport system permease protein